MNGYIKLHRKILQWEWFKDSSCLKMFIYCLLNANYGDSKYKGVELKKGTFIKTLKEMSEETGLTIQQIRTALDKLEATNEITRTTTNKNTLISVKKWAKYQIDEELQQANKQTNNKQITNGIYAKNNKKNKKEYSNEYSKNKIFKYNDEILPIYDETKNPIIDQDKLLELLRKRGTNEIT